ncbi:MAG: TadE family protein [Planctomycetota bacterium]
MTKFHRSQSHRRRGVAAVEFAVCLPVIVLLVFGSIEASSFVFLKQSLNVAAYEGVREATRLGADNASARDRARNILAARQVTGFTIALPNGESSSLRRGEEVVMEVSASTSANSPLLGRFLTDRTLTARIVMTRE